MTDGYPTELTGKVADVEQLRRYAADLDLNTVGRHATCCGHDPHPVPCDVEVGYQRPDGDADLAICGCRTDLAE